jgi:DNA invertase Pin-like site-specific DNA recombinase
MIADQLIPAAQYLRMSTERQQYSIDNQARSIEQYAKAHRFAITRTYSDSAKSGLWLRNRPGLCELLQDVTGGKTEYKAILVYDVSRWGRFQDTDEAAHYEFLCKSAGIPVHYCAETFTNDGSLPSAIMKALKRVMAGEYSRELGAKVFAGQKRLAELGFKQGGPPGYGFGRMLVGPDRNPKQVLGHGERKSIATDRVILVPGPAHEIEQVQEIYKMFTADKMSFKAIARDLNRRGIPSARNAQWTHSVVTTLLSHPRYVGCAVFNQTSRRLGACWLPRPRSEWVISPGAHQAIVDPQTFALAQEIIASRTIRKTNDQLLQDLRSQLAARGTLSNRLIDETVGMAAARTYWYRFGGFCRACELIGYDWRKRGRKSDAEMLQHLRSLLVANGHLSTSIINSAPRLISSDQIRWRFGSLRRAYELIGYECRKPANRVRC